MRLGRTRQKQVFIYRQKHVARFEGMKEMIDFVGDFNITEGGRKRIAGRTPKVMGSTLALNLDKEEFDELCLRVELRKFEALIRSGGTIPSKDILSALGSVDIQKVILGLEERGIISVLVDKT